MYIPSSVVFATMKNASLCKDAFLFVLTTSNWATLMNINTNIVCIPKGDEKYIAVTPPESSLVCPAISCSSEIRCVLSRYQQYHNVTQVEIRFLGPHAHKST